MRLKKTMALICSLAMAASVAVSSAIVAEAADGYSVALDFAGYEVKGTTTFAKINVNLTVPDTMSPYTMNAADWETTFEDTYSGFTVQGIGIDIPNVDGLTYVASLSTAQKPVSINNNTTGGKVQLSYAATGEYSEYYGESISKTLATLYYRITGDVNGTYDMTITNCVVGYAYWDGTAEALPKTKEYTYGDFAVTGCSVKPAVATEYTVTFKADDVEVSSVKVAENGTVATLPEAPAKDGYTFNKWVANGEEFTTSTVITANTTVTAEYTKNVEETYGTPITEGAYTGKTLYFDTKTMTFVFGTHKGVLIKKGSEEKKFGLKFFEDLGISGEAGSEMTFTAGVIDASGATKGTYEFSLIEK